MTNCVISRIINLINLTIDLLQIGQIACSRARGLVGYDVALTWRRSPVRIRPSPSFFLKSATLEPSIGGLSDTRIMAEKKHNKDEKLHNSDEKLHNSHELDLSWQETVDLLPEDEVEGGSEIYYFTDGDGNIHSRDLLSLLRETLLTNTLFIATYVLRTIRRIGSIGPHRLCWTHHKVRSHIRL